MNLLYYIFQHLYVHCIFGQVWIVWHYVSVVKGHSILCYIFAIISSPILRIAITLHCHFCEIFRKLLCAFAILHAWRIGISYTTGPMHHELCNNLIQLREYVFVMEFPPCTNNRVIVSYCLGLV